MGKRTNKNPIEIVKRKRTTPRTAFQKGAPNPHAFKPGQSGNPTGRAANDLRLVSRSLREQLALRAPGTICKGLGLPITSSWGQCVAASLIRSSVSGDVQAARLLSELTEGKAGVSFHLGITEDEHTGERPLINIQFTESDGNGRPVFDDVPTIDAETAETRLLGPE